LREFRAGHATRERKLAVCTGGGFAPEDRAEMLTILTGDEDDTLRDRAENALLSTPLESILAALKRPEAHARLFQYCADNLLRKPGVADAMALNPGCPGALLVPVAAQLTRESVDTLLGTVERLVDSDLLIAALAANPNITPEQRKMLEVLGEDAGIDAETLAEAAAAAEPDTKRRETLIQRLGKMRVVERIKLALTGNREERATLIRDSNKLVQRAVLQSPKLTDQEVENFASMASLNDEILRLIAANRQFIKNYLIVKRLVNNPKMPLDVSLHLLPRLTPLDMKALTMNKNVPETLRSMAIKLERQRKQAKPGG
jgi:hypothetical protein